MIQVSSFFYSILEVTFYSNNNLVYIYKVTCFSFFRTLKLRRYMIQVSSIFYSILEVTFYSENTGGGPHWAKSNIIVRLRISFQN
jgi:hypothetical protein